MAVLLMKPYFKPKEPAFPYPIFGVGVLPANPTNAEYLSVLSNKLTNSISGSTFSMDDGGLAGNKYMYFASPFDHGDLKFIDTASGILGGWDGASWPTDNNHHQTSGRVEITLTINGDTRTWYLYRTDFRNLGLKTWKIQFDETPTSVRPPQDPPPPKGWSDIATAIANHTNITVDGPAAVVKLDGQQYAAFRYIPKNGKDHIHSATGLGNATIQLFDKDAQPIGALQNLDNGPNGTDEIEFHHLSRTFPYYIVVQSLDTAGTINDFSTSVYSEELTAVGLGYEEAVTAQSNPLDIELNTPYHIQISPDHYMSYRFNLDDGKYHEFRVIAKDGGPQDAEYTVEQPSLGKVFGIINADNGPGGADEIENGLILNKVVDGIESERDDASITVHVNNVASIAGSAVRFNCDGQLTEIEHIQNADIKSGDHFSMVSNMSADGNTIVICSIGREVGVKNNQGKAYLYKKTDSQWNHVADMFGDIDPGPFSPNFGYTSAISGDASIIAVCAESESRGASNRVGAVYIYNGSGQRIAKLYPPETAGTGFNFGSSVTINFDGSVIAISSSAASTAANTHEVYVYRHANGYVVGPTVIKNKSDNDFGRFVRISDDGNRLFISHQKYVIPSQDTGVVHVFDFNGNSWTLTQNIKPLTRSPGQVFGDNFEISTDTRTVIVGSRHADNDLPFADFGEAFVFYADEAGIYQQVARLTSSVLATDGGFRFGKVSLSGDGTVAIIGAEGDDEIAADSGRIFRFELTGDPALGNWNETHNTKTSEAYHWDRTGTHIALSRDGKEVIVNANNTLYGGTNEFILEVRTVPTTKTVPMYGVGSLPAGFSSEDLLGILTESMDEIADGTTVPINAATNQYGYFAVPVTVGTVSFTDVSVNADGGWDGASWPNGGDIGTNYGPIIMDITVDNFTSEWYVYRTDFPIAGLRTYRLNYSNV